MSSVERLYIFGSKERVSEKDTLLLSYLVDKQKKETIFVRKQSLSFAINNLVNLERFLDMITIRKAFCLLFHFKTIQNLFGIRLFSLGVNNGNIETTTRSFGHQSSIITMI